MDMDDSVCLVFARQVQRTLHFVAGKYVVPISGQCDLSAKLRPRNKNAEQRGDCNGTGHRWKSIGSGRGLHKRVFGQVAPRKSDLRSDTTSPEFVCYTHDRRLVVQSPFPANTVHRVRPLCLHPQQDWPGTSRMLPFQHNPCSPSTRIGSEARPAGCYLLTVRN